MSSPDTPLPSAYRFGGPFILRLLGLGAITVGGLVLVTVVLMATVSAPSVLLLVEVLLLVAVLVALALLRRADVVRLDEAGYQVRLVRGAGVRRSAWTAVEDVSATTVAGSECVVLRLRDGRTTTIPVGVLAGRPDDFVLDLQRHLNRGHGYRKVPGRA